MGHKALQRKGSELLYIFRIGTHFYVAGIIILSLGIALCVQSMLGTSPFDALLVGLYRTFGLSIGSWEVVVGGSMIIGNALAEKKAPEWMAFITSILTGIGIDSWLFFIKPVIAPTTLSTQAICLIVGIICTAIGTALYLQSRIAPNPMDRSMMLIVERTGWSISRARIAIGAVLVTLAFMFGGAIGIGTVMNALFSGAIIGFLIPYTYQLRIRFSPQENECT